MPRSITIIDVARAAQVSVGTVSRVLNEHANVDPGIRDRVMESVRSLGYRRNPMARGMRKGSSETIGVVVRDITVPSLAAFVRAAQEELASVGYSLLLANSDDRVEREAQLLDRLSRRHVDGLIMTTASETDATLVAARREFPAPIVLLDREPEGEQDAVLIDHGAAVDQAVRYLGGLGHRRIGLVTGGETVRPGRERIAGYRRGLAACDLPFDDLLVRAGSFDGDAGQREAAALMSLAERPTAIIAGGAALLAGVLKAARSNGLDVPTHVSIVAGPDSDIAQLSSPPIAVTTWSYAEVGRMAARLLLDRLTGHYAGPGRSMTVTTDFVPRGSCGPAPDS